MAVKEGAISLYFRSNDDIGRPNPSRGRLLSAADTHSPQTWTRCYRTDASAKLMHLAGGGGRGGGEDKGDGGPSKAVGSLVITQ